MRVLHVSDCYWPRLGGIEVHLRDLVRHQRAAGHDVRVLTTTPAGSQPDDPGVIRVDGGLTHADAALCRLLRDDPPDVVHVHVSILSPLATLAARRASTLGHPTLVTVHSMWSRLGPLPAVARTLMGLRRWPITWSAVSSAAAEPLRSMLGPDVPVWVLPNAVDPEAWRPRTDRRPEVPTVVSVMRLTHTKRTMPLGRILLDVRRRVPAELPLRAVVAGDGPQRAALGRYLRRHRLDDWVDLPGRLERTEIRELLDRSSVYLAPAELESFGIAALEARAAGLPVVASSASGVGEFVTHGTGGLLGATDADLAEHVARLVTDADLWTRISEHNSTVPPGHDWAAACARTDALYLEAAATSIARARRHAAPRLTLAAGGR